MKVPISWLKDYVDITLSINELAHRMTLAGLEIGNIEYVGVPCDVKEAQKYAMPFSTDHLVWDREKIVIGHIHEVKPHPDADRLVLAMVDDGTGELKTVVTGAPNLYDYKGKGELNPPLVTPYAREGAEVIDGHGDGVKRLIIKPKKLRGIMNSSMVCSGMELGIPGGDHGGIMLLDGVDAEPGTPLQDVLGEIILDVELTPNLARCFSIMGVAREVSALTGQPLKEPSYEFKAEGASIEGQAKIDIREPELNPRFTLALIKGIDLKPSPDWLQRRLEMVGMRPINNIVDVTNYVMMETGQPLHAFDYDVLVERAGGTPTIITRLPEKGEKLTTLDDVERNLSEFTIMVADTAGSLSLGGIMGGEESEVYDSRADENDGIDRPSTTNVLLESANWNYINIRKTLSAQREMGKEISSEAGARFSRGVHPAQAEKGLRRAIELMRELAGGEIAQGIVDSYPLPPEPVSTTLPLSEVDRLLGIALTQDEVVSILESLEFEVERVGDDAVKATVPDHRVDIGNIHDPTHEDIRDVVIQADLIEEIARIYGYDKIPNTMLVDELPPQRNNDSLTTEERLSDILVTLGLQEIVTYRLVTPEREALLTPPGLSSSLPDVPYIQIANPISVERTVMRHSLMATMLEVMAQNTRWRDSQQVFEVARVYLPNGKEKLPAEPRRLSIGLIGGRDVTGWQDGKAHGAPMDFYDLKGIVEEMVYGLHLESVQIEAGEHNSFFPGRVANLKVNGKDVGPFGELQPQVVEAFGLGEQSVMMAEFDLEILLSAMDKMHEVSAISSFPAVYEDIAVVVDEGVPASEVEEVVRLTGGFLLKDVTLFDVYRGEQLGHGKKSLAYSLIFQAPDKTLTDKTVAKLRSKITGALQHKLKATLRE